MNKILSLSLLLLLQLLFVTSPALASSDSTDDDDSESNDSGGGDKEVCSITLKDGVIVEMVRETIVLNDGTEIEMHSCEQLQVDWGDATYDEYLGNTPEANQAKEITGKMFSEGLSYSEAKRELAMDKLADEIFTK